MLSNTLLPLIVRVSMLALLLFGLTFAPDTTRAADPPDDRPYIELPFPRDTRYVVTCGYDCYQHHGSMTYAVDFRVPEGDPIVAAAAGEVMAVTWEIGLPANLDLGDALIIYIDHGNNWFTRYVHLQGITVEVGDHVAMGDIIGYSGKTGTQGAHLHFELKHGTSLHSPAVPINELFDGYPPRAGTAYLSNNGALPPADTVMPAAPETARSALLPTITPATTSNPALPLISEPLTLNTGTFMRGAAVEATFTLKNNTASRLHLEMLGIAGREANGASLRSDLLLFDRAVILNPGREYQFKRSITLDRAGPAELFVFALGHDNEWIPLGGANTPLAITVGEPILSHHTFLPALMGSAATEKPVAAIPTVEAIFSGSLGPDRNR